MHTPKKSTNINSTTGRIPSAAAPVAAPIKAVSDIGVSITRSAPNLSNNPPVAPKIPPYLATSSPITKTFSSLSISCAIPSEIAAAIVNSRLFSFPIIFSYLCNYTKTCSVTSDVSG